jgi:hypothetical protein
MTLLVNPKDLGSIQLVKAVVVKPRLEVEEDHPEWFSRPF